jgi:succinate dehydrogenase/fumarate reductase flavoprotein subunit
MADGYDYIIVGSGIAGLYAALLAKEHGSVLVVTKGSIEDTNSRWAQGGSQPESAGEVRAGGAATHAERAVVELRHYGTRDARRGGLGGGVP